MPTPAANVEAKELQEKMEAKEKEMKEKKEMVVKFINDMIKDLLEYEEKAGAYICVKIGYVPSWKKIRGLWKKIAK